jgi:hypothetical protein
MTTTPGSSNSQAAYLVTTKKFSADPVELEPLLNKTYSEISQAVNFRSIGLYELTQITTGNKYYNTGIPQDRRQSFRRVFEFGAIATGTSIEIQFDMTQITQVVNFYGNVITDNTASLYRAINWTSSTDVTEQIQVDFDTSVTPNVIRITVGAGAPNVVSGMVVIEYLLN